MNWREDLVISKITIEEKGTIFRKKQLRRNDLFAKTLIFSFFGSFFVCLLLIFLKVLGRFPQSAVVGFLLWMGWVFGIYGVVQKLKNIFLKKDQNTWSSIEFSEESREVYKRIDI
jgi:hypothetical protein